MFKKIKSLLLENQSVRQTVAKNTFWLAVSNFGGRFLRAIVIIFAARILGPAEWGVFNYAITIVTFLTLFVDSGINQILVRDRARAINAQEKQLVTATTLWMKLIFLGVGSLIVLTVAPRLPTADVFIGERAAALFPIMIFILVFDTIREFYHAILRAEERMEREAASYLLTNVLIVVFGFMLLMAYPTVRGFTIAYALGAGVGAVAATFLVRTYLSNAWSGFSWSAAHRLIAAAWPYAVASALGMLMISTDIVMLGWFRSSEEVGWYSAPQRIIQLIYLVPGIISISILPVFSRLALQSKERVASAIEHSLTVAYLAALPIAVGGIIVAPSLIKLLFGSPFLPGATPMQILFLTLLADFPAVLLGNVLLAYNQQKNLVTYSAIGGFMNVTLNLLLIPRFGIVGCAIATLGAQIASNAYLQRVVRRTNPFRVLPKITNAILATMIMGVCVFLLQSAGVHVIASIVLGALAYGGVLYLRGEPLLFEFRKVISGPLPVRETK